MPNKYYDITLKCSNGTFAYRVSTIVNSFIWPLRPKVS